MVRVFKCDYCGKEVVVRTDNRLPADFFLIRVYSCSQKRGGKSIGYHYCKECKEKHFDNPAHHNI